MKPSHGQRCQKCNFLQPLIFAEGGWRQAGPGRCVWYGYSQGRSISSRVHESTMLILIFLPKYSSDIGKMI